MGYKRFYFEKEEVKTTKVTGYIELETDYSQIYNNIFSYTILIEDKWAIKYLLWILPKANEYGYVPHSKKIIEEFIDILKKVNLKSIPSIKSVQDAIGDLVKQNILLKHGYGSYQLNPSILWNSETQKRLENIKYLKLEEGINLDPKIQISTIEESPVKFLTNTDLRKKKTCKKI